jgi:hypothetical protein
LADNAGSTAADESRLSPSDSCDTDLFFDFDVGSLVSDEDQVNGVAESSGDHDFPPSFVGIGNSPDPSTAYGSSASGVFSDQGTPSPTYVDKNDGHDQEQML